jgi:HEAT repeat protein
VQFVHLLLRDHFAFVYCLKQLGNDSPNLREMAATALGQVGTENSIPALVEALTDPDARVRLAASESLAELQWRPSDPQWQAIWLIAQQRWDESIKLGRPAVAPLMNVLDDSEWSIRRSAVNALGRTGCESPERIMGLLDDANASVRANAAWTLGQLKIPEAVPTLMRRLNDVNWNVRCYAAKALGRIGDNRAVASLVETLHQDTYEDVRHAIVEALGIIGDEKAVPALSTALDDEKVNVRRMAMNALVRMGLCAVPLLIEKLEDPGSDWDAQISAISALGLIGDPSAVQPIRTILGKTKDWTVKFAAREALVRLGVPSDDPDIALV